MMRYVRAAIGLVAAIVAVMVVHSLLSPRLVAGAYGAGLDGGLVATLVDALAAIGTWVTVMGLTAGRAVGSVMERVIDDGSGSPLPDPQDETSSIKVATVHVEPGETVADEYEQWSPAEELAGRMSTRALKDGDAGEYVRAFRLLHTDKDGELSAVMPPHPPEKQDPPQTTQPASKPRTSRKK